MKTNFDYFVKKIPTNIHNNTKSIFSSNIAIFIPNQFVINKKLNVEDYHFVILYSTPPLATVGSKDYQIKKGSLLCLAPGEEITVHSSLNTSQVKYMAVCVNQNFFKDVYCRLGGKGDPLFKKPVHTYSYQLLEGIGALIHEILHYGESNPWMLDILETRIAIQLMRDSHIWPAIPKGNQSVYKDYIKEAIHYIETYYSSNITIKDICESIYISPSYFQKLFLKTMGQTPYQYIMEFRHNKAKDLLKKTDVSVEEVARLCGFVSHAHFSTIFKTKEGITPLTYRRQEQVI